MRYNSEPNRSRWRPTVSSMQTTSRVPTALNDDYTAHSNTGDCFPPQTFGLSKLEDEGPTSIEIDPCIGGLKGVELAERHHLVGEQSPGDFLDSQRIFKCQSLNLATTSHTFTSRISSVMKLLSIMLESMKSISSDALFVPQKRFSSGKAA